LLLFVVFVDESTRRVVKDSRDAKTVVLVLEVKLIFIQTNNQPQRVRFEYLMMRLNLSLSLGRTVVSARTKPPKKKERRESTLFARTSETL